ncbi:MAG: hypothetical protein FWF12_04025 [Betaproteobacteria bacterium]|nr:hypothetical protein [Betaproteobacteria bacterium]
MSEILIDQERNYYINLREFPSGEFEAVLKVVRPFFNDVDSIQACMDGCATNSAWMYPRIEREEEDAEEKAQRNHARAVRRARQNIRWLCKTMQADRLFTLTYRENQTDRDQVRADFQKFLRLVRSGWRGTDGVPDWQYVAVLEKQERGAYHIHCAVKGYQRVKFLRAAWYKALGGSGFESGSSTPGNVDVTNPDRKRWGHTGREWKSNKLASYLTKYLAKTFDSSTSEKKRYWHVRDLKSPVVQKHWLGGASMPEAIKSAWSMLDLSCGITVDCSMWISSQNDVCWIAGGSG